MFRSDKQRQSKKDKLQKDPPSSGSAGGGAFVVKRPAHLRSAVAHRNASLNSSPSVERLSSPTKGAAGGGGSLNAARLRASGSSTTGATSPEACTAGAASGDNDVPRSHMLAIVLPSLEEFVHEREVLRNVLVDLQQHFAELDLDLECCTLFEMEDVLQNVDECVLLGELLAQRNATALVFIGDRYGEALLPLELRPEEFDALREAALETADDVAVLLNQFYVLDRGGGETGRAAEYQLKASRDPAGAQRLRRGLQRCARRLFDGDGALALQPDAAQRHAQLFKSFIEWCAHAAEANGQSVLVTRRFHGVQNAAAGGGMERWMDAAGSERAEHLNALKNALSTRLLNNPQQRLLSFLLDLRLQQKIEIDPSSWWTKCPKESAAYELELATKLTDRLKSLILAAHPNIEQPRHPPLHEPRTAAMAIVQAEHCVHSAHLASRIAPRWVPRGDAIDSHLEAIVKRLFDKDENQLKSAGLFVQFHGQPGSGKTAALCRLYQLVHDRLANAAGDGKQSPPPVVALARFSHLTDGTVFANEMLRNAFLIVCKQYMPTTPDANANANAEMIDAFLGAFHLTEVLAQAKALLEQAHTLQVLLLLDDVHLLRFGRALGRMDNALRKLFPRLHIVCTSASAQPMLGFPRSVELLALSAPTADQAIGILSDPLRPLPSDQLSALRAQFHRGGDAIDLVLGAVQRDELLAGHTEVSMSIDARLARAEQRCGGTDAVRLVCEFLCCAPCGLTRAELLDAVRLRNFTAGFMFEPQDVLNASPLHVLRNLAPMLDSVLVDARHVLFFRHHSIAQAAKQRYLTSPGEIKLANETIASLFRDADSDVDAAEDAAGGASSAEERAAVAAAVLLFPRPIAKEGGAGVDIRRVRFHWYYLLYTGNVEALKKETLCFFPYLEAAFRACGLARLLSIFEECLQQILDHDLLVIFEQVLLPGIQTLIREPRQFVSEFLNRLRYTRAKNSVYLNILVEQAMSWTDNYADSSLLVPLTCWIPPPKMKQVLSFTLSQWKSCKLTILQPTHNHQHLLVAGNELAPDCIYMFHIASQLLVRTFASSDQKQVTSLCASKWRDTGESVQQQQQHNHHFFVSTSTDGAVRVWSFTQAQCLKTLRACNARILCSVLSNDDQWMAVGSADSCARVLLLDSGQVTRTFKEHTGPVVGLQLSSDNTLLVTGSGEFVVMVWDIERGEIVVRLQGLMAPVTCLALTSNDAFLAVACEDETLRVFSLVSAQELHELTGHESRINALVASADDCKLFAGTRGRVIVYDIHNGQLLEVLQCTLERQPITSLRISDDDSFVLVACGDRIHMWALDSIERDVAAVQQQKMATALSVDAAQPTTSQLPPATTSVSCVQIAPDEKSAGCGTADGIVAFWDLDVCQCMWTSNAQRNGAVSALCFSADSFLLLSGSEQGTVSLWETNNGQLLKQVQLHAEAVVALCAFADGIRVLSCDSADNAYLWSLGSLDESAAGKRMELIASIAHMHPPLYVRLSDTVLIAQHGANPREMNVWSVSGDRLFTRSKVHHNEAILCYGVNRCGTVLCTGSQDLSLKVWQMDSGGLLIQVLVGHEDAPTCCCVSEDALAACSGALDRLLIVWDVQTGAALHALRRAAVQCFIEISMDGSVVCSSGEDGWIEAWHYKSGRLLSAFDTHRQVEQLIMGADGDRILAKLAGTAQLPIICLHNTPANLHSTSASRYERVVLPTAAAALDASPSAPAAKSVVTVGGRPLVLEFSTTTTAAATEDDDDGPMPLGDNVSTNEKEEPVTSRASEVEAHANKLRDAEEEQKRRRAEQVPNFEDAPAPTAQSAASVPPSGGADAAASADAAAPVPSTSTPAQKERRTRRSKMCTVN